MMILVQGLMNCFEVIREGSRKHTGGENPNNAEDSQYCRYRICDQNSDILKSRVQSGQSEFKACRIDTSNVEPVSQDISEPDESEPFRFILALVAGFFGTIPINPDPSGRIFRNHQDISEPAIRSSALMNF